MAILGCTLAARCAGSQAAMIATTVSNRRGRHQNARIRRTDAERECRKPSPEHQRAAETSGEAESDDHGGLTEDERPRLRGGRPERDPDANLPGTLAHRVGEDPVEPEGGEQEGNEGEGAHQHEGEPLTAGAATDHIGHRGRPVHHELRIERRHGVTHGAGAPIPPASSAATT